MKSEKSNSQKVRFLHVLSSWQLLIWHLLFIQRETTKFFFGGGGEEEWSYFNQKHVYQCSRAFFHNDEASKLHYMAQFFKFIATKWLNLNKILSCLIFNFGLPSRDGSKAPCLYEIWRHGGKKMSYIQYKS